MKDLRDPSTLGQKLIHLAQETSSSLRRQADLNPFVPDYDHNPGPVEKYGDPRLIPTTMP